MLGSEEPMLFAELVALFIAGLCLDALNTLYVSAVADKRRLKAAVLSGVGTIVGFLIYARVMSYFEADMAVAGGSLAVYAAGHSAGTWLGLRPHA
jgi:uncharacterized membrane protein (GlpM family)